MPARAKPVPPALSPICAAAPRYAPGAALPPYRHVPGRTPHPVNHPEGHSFNQPEPPPTPLNPAGWRLNKIYLFGVDLYNQGYLWESHEAWESLWKTAGRRSIEGRFLQSLIFNSAALLKFHVGRAKGGVTHSRRAVAQLEAVLDALEGARSFMGVDLPEWKEQLEKCYAPLWRSAASRRATLSDAAPCLRLRGEA